MKGIESYKKKKRFDIRKRAEKKDQVLGIPGFKKRNERSRSDEEKNGKSKLKKKKNKKYHRLNNNILYCVKKSVE